MHDVAHDAGEAFDRVHHGDHIFCDIVRAWKDSYAEQQRYLNERLKMVTLPRQVDGDPLGLNDVQPTVET